MLLIFQRVKDPVTFMLSLLNNRIKARGDLPDKNSAKTALKEWKFDILDSHYSLGTLQDYGNREWIYKVLTEN